MATMLHWAELDKEVLNSECLIGGGGVSGPWASPGIPWMECTSKVTTGIWEVRESKTVNKGSTDFRWSV